jgi:hypothetical protein
MPRRRNLGIFGLAVIFAAVPSARPAAAQGMENVLHAKARLFPAVGPGLSVLKRDSAGRYYILAEPATTVLIYDATGKPAGQIPNANSHGATIRYAVDIDIDSQGRLFVVDRGSNAVKIFAPNGALVAAVPVNAPTSIAVLSDGQFAVTTLQSKRLVQIMDEKGATIRTFGDPADLPGSQQKQKPQETTPAEPLAQPAIIDRGRIIGDPAGNIYFVFSSLPDPTVQVFDRFGYSAYQAVVSANSFGAPDGRGGHKLELGYTMTEYGWPTSVSAWTDLHSLSSLSFARGMRRGIRGDATGSESYGEVNSQGNTLDFTALGSPDIFGLDPDGLDRTPRKISTRDFLPAC